MKAYNGYEELAHTADWALRVWAENLEGLLATAAKGMHALAAVKMKAENDFVHRFSLPIHDRENLLVDFLSEIVYIWDTKHYGIHTYELLKEGEVLKVTLTGAEIIDIKKEIKAVTYYDLKIMDTIEGLEAVVVFDV